MLRRQLLAPVAAHKGERHPARDQRIGDATYRVAAEIGVEEGAVHLLAFERGKRIAYGRQWTDHHEPTLLQRTGNIEGDEKLVLHHQDTFRCRHFSPVLRLSSARKLSSISARLIKPL
jgi:hypothetical protein